MNRFERRHIPRKRGLMGMGTIVRKPENKDNKVNFQKSKVSLKKNSDDIIKISNFSNVRNLSGDNSSMSSIDQKMLEMRIKNMEDRYENRILELESKLIEQKDNMDKMSKFFDLLTKNLKTQSFDNFKKIQATRKLLLSTMSQKVKDFVGVDETFIENISKIDFMNTLNGENMEEKKMNEVVIKKVGEDQFGEGSAEKEKEDVDKSAPTTGNGYFSKSEALKNLKQLQPKKQAKVENEKISTEPKNDKQNVSTESSTENTKPPSPEKPKPKILRKRRRRNRVVLDVEEK